MEDPLEFEVLESSDAPEDSTNYTDDNDVSKMRELANPRRFQTVGRIDPALVDDMATLQAMADELPEALGLLHSYVENYFLMTRSENGFGSEQMVSVAKPESREPKSRFFKWGKDGE